MAHRSAVRPSSSRSAGSAGVVRVARVAALAILVGGATAVVAPTARADRASAASAMPAGGQPFLLVVRSPWSSNDWDEVPRRPEIAVYPDGQLLMMKSDGRLWGGVLPREQVLDLMDFLASDVQMASLAMTYYVSSPLTTFTTYTFTTRSGTNAVRRRASGGFGTNVKPVEAQLDRVDRRLLDLADRADRPYAPGRLLVVSRPVVADPALPVWAWNDAVPFAALGEATDLARRGAILTDADARLVRDAAEQSAAWRFGELALELRLRPALPHESALGVWRNPAAKAPPVAVVPPVAVIPPVAVVPPVAVTPPSGPAPTPSSGPPPPPPPSAAPSAPRPPAPTEPAPIELAPRRDGAPAGPAVPAPTLPDVPPPPIPAPSAPAAATPASAAVPAPAPAPSVAAPPTATVGASDWRANDLDFAGLQQLLTDMNRKTSGSPHGDFWKKDYDAFLKYEFALQTVEGKVKLLEPGNSAGSNLVRALRGAPMLVRKPDGRIQEEAFSVMPPKGAPMKAADLERVARWIDHGAPKTRPDGAAPAATPPTPTGEAPFADPVPSGPVPSGPGPEGPAASTAPAEAKVVSQVALSLVGADTVKLGSQFAAEDGNAPPRLFVACDAAGWERIFTDLLPNQGGPHGATVAARLATIRAAVKGYDWDGAPLVLIVGPASDNYAWACGTAVDVLADGTGRIPLTHTHETRIYAAAPEIGVRWALHRADTTGCPRRIVLKTPATIVPAIGAN